MVLGLGVGVAAARGAAEVVGLFDEALEADLPGEDVVAVEGAVGLEEVAAAGGVLGVGERGGAAPGAGEARGLVSEARARGERGSRTLRRDSNLRGTI